MDINQIRQALGLDQPAPGSLTVSPELREQTKETHQEQQEMLASWEGGADVDLETLCNAFLTTSEDVENINRRIEAYDADSQVFLKETQANAVETVARLKKLIATVAAK